MPSSYGFSRSIASLPTVMFVTSMATFALSWVVVKLLFLALFLLVSIVRGGLRNRLAVYPRLVMFYLATCVAGVVWAIVGLLHHGNYVLGVFEALRLYVVWSVAFLVLYSLLRSAPSLGLIHASMVLSGIMISTINLVGLADQLGGWGLIPEDIRQALELRIGIHDGYIQMTSYNIGSLFLIVPYLLSLQFRTDATIENTWLTKLTLVMCLFVTAVSGRRALWLVVALTPITILLMARVTDARARMEKRGRRLLGVYSVAAVLVLGTRSMLPARIQEIGYVRYLRSAFSTEDERTIQKEYLVDAFAESPVLGSGFGAYAGYLRSEERPWTYELTYHQLLFNVGIVGLAVLGGFFCLYFIFVTKLLRQFKDGSAIPFGLLVGFCSLLVGVYSNPYFGSFDFLFFVGLLPYLSTFRLGFDRPAARVES